MTQTLPANITDMRLSDLLKVQGVTVIINVTTEATPPPVIMSPPPPTERMLRIEEVSEMIGMSGPWIYKKVSEGSFPAQVKLGGSSRWQESEVRKWMEKR